MRGTMENAVPPELSTFPKMANVLVQERSGQYRGILADFDVSKDDKGRRQATSMTAMSTAREQGLRGTIGLLTMAPDVF